MAAKDKHINIKSYNQMFRTVLKTAFFIILALAMGNHLAVAAELEKRTVCTWDPVGKQGPVIAFFSDVIPHALKWGLDLNFVPYEDERQAAKDLFTDKCDIAIVTAILSRDFVPFAGTLDAIGGLTSEDKLRRAMATIASPKAAPYMATEEFEVVASLPLGSMFAFVTDRKIRYIDDFRNKKIAVLNGDMQASMFAELAEAIPVDETLTSFASSFNEHNVDIVLMPALAYETFELYKGLGDSGGIIDLRMFYGMLQAVSKKSRFDDTFGIKMRQYMFTRLNTMLTIIENAENSIPRKYWIQTPAETKASLDEFYKDIRLALKIENRLDSKALALLWKIRCSTSPNRDECEVPKDLPK